MERLFRNLATTAIGLVLISASLALVYLEKATITEASGWLTLGLTLVRAKDTLIGRKAKK